MWDQSVKGFRLKKRGKGSRYVKQKFHQNEIKLTKIVEELFGKNNVITEYHPVWAVSPKIVLYEFDIHVKGTNLLIEYNGQQHYKFTKFFHKTRKRFEEQLLRDAYKALLAESKGFELEIFSYEEPIIKDYVRKRLEQWL